MRLSMTKGYITNCRALARQMEERDSDENRDPNITAEENVYNGTAHKWQRVLWTQDGFIKDSDYKQGVGELSQVSAR